jgi:DNA modification methylase
LPPPRATAIQRGDLFDLGPHRLLCGDSTSAVDVARVMDDDGTAALCLTDPPYGIGESYSSLADTPEHLAALVAAFFPLARRYAERVLLTPGNGNQRLYPPPDWTLCWFVAAGTGRSRWGFSCWQPVLAYGSDPYLAIGQGARPDALSKTESAENTLGHPCPKPVGVWSWFMERGSAREGDAVLDVFTGSGTSLIAAEQLGRRCRGIEIDPSYCQVAIDRWEAFTGLKAAKVGEAVR